MISIKPKKRWFSSPSPFDNCPQNKGPKLKTERNQAHMSTLLKSDIEAEHQCLRKEKDLHQTKHQVSGCCSFSGMRWLLGAHAKPVQRQLNQPKGIATFTVMCQKASVFFAFCHVSMSFADEASAFPEVFSMIREHPMKFPPIGGWEVWRLLWLDDHHGPGSYQIQRTVPNSERRFFWRFVIFNGSLFGIFFL